MLENATRICEAKFGNLVFADGDEMFAVAAQAYPARRLRLLQPTRPQPAPAANAVPLLGASLHRRRSCDIADITAESGRSDR